MDGLKSSDSESHWPAEFDHDFASDADIDAFARAFGPDESDDQTLPEAAITALPDWAPIKQRIKRTVKRNRDGERNSFCLTATSLVLLLPMSHSQWCERVSLPHT